MPDNPHGGKRKGAGRKPKPDAKVTVALALSPDVVAALDAKAGDASRSSVADAILRRSLRASGHLK